MFPCPHQLISRRCIDSAGRSVSAPCLCTQLILGPTSGILELERVAEAFSIMGEEISLDEIQCILANLIFKGYLKGCALASLTFLPTMPLF